MIDQDLAPEQPCYRSSATYLIVARGEESRYKSSHFLRLRRFSNVSLSFQSFCLLSYRSPESAQLLNKLFRFFKRSEMTAAIEIVPEEEIGINLARPTARRRQIIRKL